MLIVLVAIFLRAVHAQYPVDEWLFFRYVKYWGYAALFSTASLAAGLRLLGFVLPYPPRAGERLTLGFALGVLAFALGVFLFGLAGQFGKIFFFAWPSILLAFGGPQLWRDFRRARAHLRRFGLRLLLPKGGVELLAAVLIVISTLAIYLQVLTPQNMSYDAGWYHLPIAEQYVAAGAIRPFAEGWYLGAYPQLASLLYTWAFQSPGTLFDHQALASHIEWALFLATLPALSALVRKLLFPARTPFAAAALFLFPGIFLYDSNLSTGADHILAFWAPALGIALVRMGRSFTIREAVLGGALLAAAVLTKYQACYFVVPSALFVLVLTARWRRPKPALAWGITALLVSSAHWLKNWIFYGDPFYPLLNGILHDHPFFPGAAAEFEKAFWPDAFALHGTLLEKTVETLKVLVTFSFVPHDWGTFHGETPVFGSLFTLTVPMLLCFRRTLKTWLLVIAVHLGIVVWFVTSHQDRFLQALLPWMAASTAVALALAWREGVWVRTGVAVLVAAQVVWGGDVYFFRTHAMVGDAPLKATIDFIAAGHRKEYESRFLVHNEMREIGKGFPTGAKVLLHRSRDRLGIGVPTVVDETGWQGAIEYLDLGGPRAVDLFWRSLGITHVLWRNQMGDSSPADLAREAVFASALRALGEGSPRTSGDWRITKLRSSPQDLPETTPPLRIAWLGCGGDPPLGVYKPAGLAKRVPDKTLTEGQVENDTQAALLGVDALVLRPSCGYASKAKPAIERQFELHATAGDVGLWTRKSGETVAGAGLGIAGAGAPPG
jgi:hypothetical protein